jgi:hypothetical protein
MPQTYKPSLVTQHYVDLLIQNQRQLGLNAVYYGDLKIIGAVPCVCIEPARMQRSWQGFPAQTENRMALRFIVYNTGNQGVEAVQAVCDNVTEQIIDLVNLDAQPLVQGGTSAGGLIISGLVTETVYGYRTLLDETMRANSVIFEVLSKTSIVE